MKISSILYFFLFIVIIVAGSMIGTGCAQIGAPTGGPRDSIPPRLVNASPPINSTSFNGNKITLTFNEYIEVKDVQTNVLVSPYQKINPVIDYKLKTVTVKLKDTLRPNTTYAINFGNAIVDNNEGNPLKNFTYVFSTGNHIDSLNLSGKVTLAETGGIDSSLLALLYRSADDSAVQKRKPDYIAKLSGDGSFNFNNLPPGSFKIYALKDGDGSKTYNAKVETFAFADAPVIVGAGTQPVTLYAYNEVRDTRGIITAPVRNNNSIKILRYTSSIAAQQQDLLTALELSFNKPLKKFDPSKFILTDTNYKPLALATATLDSTRKNISFPVKWQAGTKYSLIVNASAVADSSDISLAKTDTLRFTTKKGADYGKLLLRFSNLDLSKNPVLQFVQFGEIKESSPVVANEWSKTLFPPGEYEIRILYDNNKNGKWDPGNYSKKLQPEKVIILPQKLGIKADWENERDIKL